MKETQNNFLPITKEEAKKQGNTEFDVILVSGDAYIDHPSFGTAIIGRYIESLGFSVAIIPQPNWQDDLRDFKKFGKPRLFFGVSSGSMDSMVNHYTANKRKRSDDAYTPGGESGFRPDRATVVYSKILKKIFPDVPIVIGGIEASLRRAAHYDYWSNSLYPSILEDSKADLLVYGMGEQPIKELLKLIDKGVPIESIKTIRSTSYLIQKNEVLPKNKKWEDLELNSYAECLLDVIKFENNFNVLEKESNIVTNNRLIQKTNDNLIVINPPYRIPKEKVLDSYYALPFKRAPHPKYKKRGLIPAWDMIKNSVNIHRGCFGGCSFCTISMHQGKFIQSRSVKSILAELHLIAQDSEFKGHISDLGGPSANMYKMQGIEKKQCQKCIRPSCIYPNICKNLDRDHAPLLDLYKEASKIEGIKKITIGSGLRYDLFLSGTAKELDINSCGEYLNSIVKNHVSGRFKVAPEHASASVLKDMRKPTWELFEKLVNKFNVICKKNDIKQEIVPYYISEHPGATYKDEELLKQKDKKLGIITRKIQKFTPTPLTKSTMEYYKSRKKSKGK